MPKKQAAKLPSKTRSRRALEEDLERINKWFDSNLISPASFDRQKAAILKEMEDANG
jgi:hypothetical protein